MVQIVSILFGLVLSSATPAVSPYIPLSQWHAQAGDRFIADTQENVGYLVHEDGSYTSMVIGSGRRETVHYIGKTYDATTPPAQWEVQDINIQNNRAIFGKTGRFLRLFQQDEYTNYGIHSVGNIDDILASDNRYMSMGCVLVNDAILDILIATYHLNGDSLDVVTTYGLNESLLTQPIGS